MHNKKIKDIFDNQYSELPDLLEENGDFSQDFTSIRFVNSERVRSRGNESFIFRIEAKLKSKSKRSKKRQEKK